MKLQELSRRTGASIPTLKFWMRERILPAGALRNQTTAVYGEQHVERVELIQTLRAEFDASIAEIRELTSAIDDASVPLLEVMERCQLIATGLRAGDDDAEDAARVDEVLRAAGWPEVSSVARSALAGAIAQAQRLGTAFSAEDLVEYARALSGIAARDVAAIRPGGSRDAVARNLLRGAAAQARVLLAMNQLAHTSAAIAAVR